MLRCRYRMIWGGFGDPAKVSACPTLAHVKSESPLEQHSPLTTIDVIKLLNCELAFQREGIRRPVGRADRLDVPTATGHGSASV